MSSSLEIENWSSNEHSLASAIENPCVFHLHENENTVGYEPTMLHCKKKGVLATCSIKIHMMLPQACNNTFLRQYQKTQLTTKDQMWAKGALNRLILWAKGADQSQSARNWAIDCELQKLFLQRPSGNLTWIAFTCDRFLCQTWVKQIPS